MAEKVGCDGALILPLLRQADRRRDLRPLRGRSPTRSACRSCSTTSRARGERAVASAGRPARRPGAGVAVKEARRLEQFLRNVIRCAIASGVLRTLATFGVPPARGPTARSTASQPVGPGRLDLYHAAKRQDPGADAAGDRPAADRPFSPAAGATLYPATRPRWTCRAARGGVRARRCARSKARRRRAQTRPRRARLM